MIQTVKIVIVVTILIASPRKNQANMPLPLEPAADFRKEKLTNNRFGTMNAKPPKITEYANSRLTNTKKRSPHTVTVPASSNNILYAVERFFIISSVPANHTTPQIATYSNGKNL